MPAFNILKTYDFAAVKMVIGSQVITGYGDDGGIVLAPESDDWEHTVGADGEVSAAAQNDERVVATITVKATSRAARILWSLYKTQKLARPILPLPFLMTDPLLGDIVPSTYCLFLNMPEIGKEKATGEYEFRVLLPYAKKGMAIGNLNIL